MLTSAPALKRRAKFTAPLTRRIYAQASINYPERALLILTPCGQHKTAPGASTIMFRLAAAGIRSPGA
jgi:hypothetical protein